MSNKKLLDEIIKHKKHAIHKIDGMFEKYISMGDDQHLKKVDLLSYWFEDFTEYIKQEEQFDPKRLLRYSRGDIIKVNFGFRVGSEMGGLHFAVVLNNNNSHSSPVITVVPLSSTDGRKINPNNVDLGTELYSKAFVQNKSLARKAQKKVDEIESLLESIDKAEKSSPDLMSLKSKVYSQYSDLQLLVKRIQKNSVEINKMKSGSMAVMNQITTLSKQRIYAPKKSEDFLYGVSLSGSSMDKINSKLIEQLIRIS